MALKGSYYTLLLSLVLLGAWLDLASGQSQRRTNDRFLRRHWDNPKTQAPTSTTYCDLQTNARGLAKKNNIFIHARIALINNICTTGGTPSIGNQSQSIRRFRLTVCKLNADGNTYTERRLARRIVVSCRNKLPVRLVRIIRFRPSV
ncbi:5-hydroxytryptamine receptor 5A-like [Platysternon megacephalum]|uniref:5-hydroxytryptamine receptor 5A-like n=1 Tax=Platysternon megacephalum TaxID=55544 RepID=A0A4D9DGG2_9SAUR|nr:5-hydroxytryptamine receptor 5A-like [Platysternon megacephalum]